MRWVDFESGSGGRGVVVGQPFEKILFISTTMKPLYMIQSRYKSIEIRALKAKFPPR